VIDFKHFLQFAEQGARAIAEAFSPTGRGTDSPFEDAVMKALENKGWLVHPRVGASFFRVDLDWDAVISEKDHENHLCQRLLLALAFASPVQAEACINGAIAGVASHMANHGKLALRRAPPLAIMRRTSRTPTIRTTRTPRRPSGGNSGPAGPQA
jgi:hypothetical protein